MSDNPFFPSPNVLGETFSESGIGGGGGGGGAVSTYTLSQSINQVVLTPDGGGTISQVNIADYPVVLNLQNRTQYISATDNETLINGSAVITQYLKLNSDNKLTTSGSGTTASLLINNIPIGGGSVGDWAKFPATSNVVIPNSSGVQHTLQINPNNYNAGFPLYTYPTSVINQNLQVGQPSIIVNNAPNISFYPTDFIVGDDTILGASPARTINLYSGAGGTSIRALQGIALRAGVDINLTATADINLLAAATTIQGAVNITGATNTTGNVSIEGAFEVVGASVLGGETSISGNTNITGITTITGGTSISGLASLNGGCAVVGGLGVAGLLSLTGGLTQASGSITTSGDVIASGLVKAPQVNVGLITDNGSGKTSIAPATALALTNLSSINGFPYTSGANAPWYNVPAGGNVNMGTFGLSNTSGLTAPLVAGSNLSLLAPLGGIGISAPNIVAISGSGGVGISSDIGVDITAPLKVYGNTALVGSTITGVSTINGQPYGGSASSWANFPAITNVNIASNTINNAKIINVASGQNFSLVNALTATTIQGGSQLNLTGVANGANVQISAGAGGNVVVQSPLSVSSITNVSSINGSAYPPTINPWYNTPAGANVNMNNFNLSNANNVYSQPGDLSFIVGGGSSNSYVKFNDSGAGFIGSTSNPNMTFTTKNTDPTLTGRDCILFDTNAIYTKGGVVIQSGDLLISGAGAVVQGETFTTGDTIITDNGVRINGGGSYVQFPDSSRQYTAYPFPYIPGAIFVVGQTWIFTGFPQPQLPISASTLPPPDNFYIAAMNYGFAPQCNRSPSSSYPFFQPPGQGTNVFQVSKTGIYRLTFSCDATQPLPSPVGTGGGFTLSLRSITDNITISGQMAGQFQRYMTASSEDQIFVGAPTCGTFTGVLNTGINYGMYLANPPYTTFGMKGLQLDNVKWAWEFLGTLQT